MKKFKIIQNVTAKGQNLDKAIQMRQNSQMSSDFTASDIRSVQSSFCIDNHSFVSDHAGFESDLAGLGHQKLERDDSDDSTQSKINQRSLRNHNTLVNKNIVETQF